MLRDYQRTAITTFESCEEKNILLQMPTGSGKTFTFCEIAKRFFTENVEKVLILVHRTELLEQAKKSLGEKVFCIEKGVKLIPSNFDYYVGMVETLHRRLDKLPEFGLVIIDECHIGNFKKMPYFTNEKTRVIGVTATPINDEPLANYYGKMIMPVSIDELINNNFLLNCKVYGVASDLVGVQKFKEKRGEFDEQQLEEFYSSEKMVSNVVNAYWDFAKGEKTLIFNVNVKHNNTVYEALLNEGLNVYKVTGETPINERRQILKNFKEQNDAILCNVGVLTTGFDEPTVKTIFLNRATKSLALYLQMIGRGSRLSDNKEHFTVIDLGKNTIRHGFYDGYFDWETYFSKGKKGKDKNSEGAMPIKECPACGFTLHTRKIMCDNCGHDFEAERESQAKEEKEQKLYLLTKENPMLVPMDQLFQLAKERNWKPYAVLYKICDHIHNYQSKYKNIVTDEWCDSKAILELEKWCENYDKKFNKWHRDYILEILKTKRNEKVGK
jgi:superfamily II DNA or RNA helicase